MMMMMMITSNYATPQPKQTQTRTTAHHTTGGCEGVPTIRGGRGCSYVGSRPINRGNLGFRVVRPRDLIRSSVLGFRSCTTRTRPQGADL